MNKFALLFLGLFLVCNASFAEGLDGVIKAAIEDGRITKEQSILITQLAGNYVNGANGYSKKELFYHGTNAIIENQGSTDISTNSFISNVAGSVAASSNHQELSNNIIDNMNNVISSNNNSASLGDNESWIRDVMQPDSGIPVNSVVADLRGMYNLNDSQAKAFSAAITSAQRFSQNEGNKQEQSAGAFIRNSLSDGSSNNDLTVATNNLSRAASADLAPNTIGELVTDLINEMPASDTPVPSTQYGYILDTISGEISDNYPDPASAEQQAIPDAVPLGNDIIMNAEIKENEAENGNQHDDNSFSLSNDNISNKSGRANMKPLNTVAKSSGACSSASDSDDIPVHKAGC